MNGHWTRRDVLRASATGGIFLGIPDLGGLTPRAVAAPSEAAGPTEDARIERLAEEIMETPPDRVARFAADLMQNGLSRQQLLSACFNAGARFHGHHSAYVAHPIQVVSTEIASETSILPLFYYLSVLRFRAGQSRMAPLPTSGLPSEGKAESFFHAAMQEGDRDAADRGIIALSRSIGPQQAYRHLWMYGAERNARSGGHAAVSVANTFRTMHATGWRCAESALRFAVADGDIVNSKPRASGVHAINRERAARFTELPPRWSQIASDRGAVLELFNQYREGRPADACQSTFSLLRDGTVQAGSVWDAVFLTTAELVHRYKWPGGGALAGHSVTCTNGLHYMYRNLSDPTERLYALLEAVESATGFLARERARPALRDLQLLEIEPADLPPNDEALEEIFSLIPPKRFASISRFGVTDEDKAAGIAFAWAQTKSDYREFYQTAMHMMCVKATPEVHSFKYPMAMFENARYASAEWRPYLLAASVHHQPGTDMEDSFIIEQVRELGDYST